MQFAATLHDTHMRKGTEIAYLSHLISVSALVMENGGNEMPDEFAIQQAFFGQFEAIGQCVFDEHDRRGSDDQLPGDVSDVFSLPATVPAMEPAARTQRPEVPSGAANLADFL